MNQPSVALEANLWKLSLLRGLAFAWFPIPTIILFYQSYGLSLEQALILKSGLSLSTLIFEIPSGYIADVWGRKPSLVAGGVIWTGSLIIYCLAHSFSLFLLAEILAGLAASLISGADTALAFDTLLQRGRAQEYSSFEGRLVAIAGITEAICGLVGAIAAEINLVYPFYLQTVCVAAYGVLAITLAEPPRRATSDPGRKMWRIVRASLAEPRLRWLMGFSATLATATFLIVWLSQAYMGDRRLPIAGFGVAWAVFHGVMSLAAVGASRVVRRLGMKRTFLSLVVILSVSYILLGVVHQAWGIVFIASIYAVRGVRSPLVLNALNQQIHSSTRATVLSVNSFLFQLSFALLGPIAGWLADYSLDLTLTVCGIIFLLSGGLCWRKLAEVQVI